MAFTFDTATNLGKVRLLISDMVDSGHLFEDADLNNMLAFNSTDLYSTAAELLRSLAANKSLLAKKKSAGGYTEDLTAIAKELRATADAYEKKANSIPADAQAEQIFTDFNYGDIVTRKAMRSESD